MFYVSGSKIYLSTFDAGMKVYPEVGLVRQADDSISVVRKGGGVAKKPKRRQLCTLQELKAQFGNSIPEALPEPGPDANSGTNE